MELLLRFLFAIIAVFFMTWCFLPSEGESHEPLQPPSAKPPNSEVAPNELGQVMVLMYHGVGPREKKWVRSYENFRNDLSLLYEKGYRPISLLDYVRNRIDTPAGLTPVVLTFDDGRLDNFRVIEENGKVLVDPQSAVGILEEFHRQHPDFPLEATFFLYGRKPFGQSQWIEYKLNYIVSRGMDIGNHSIDHKDLSLKENQDPIRIQRSIGAQTAFLEDRITAYKDYKVNTLALCHGRRPKYPWLRRLVYAGQHKGRQYQNIAVLKVGSGPAPSPASRDFNPLAVPRIRASTHRAVKGIGLQSWIKYFEQQPGRRYLSDGDPKTVSIPRDRRDEVDIARVGRSSLRWTQ